jgi:hypothetical protein
MNVRRQDGHILREYQRRFRAVGESTRQRHREREKVPCRVTQSRCGSAQHHRRRCEGELTVVQAVQVVGLLLTRQTDTDVRRFGAPVHYRCWAQCRWGYCEEGLGITQTVQIGLLALAKRAVRLPVSFFVTCTFQVLSTSYLTNKTSGSN